jgi:hypothetical protein
MSSGTTAIVVVVVIVVIVAVAAVALSTRRRRLQQRFGPEYDRAVEEQSSKLRAEAELTDRQRRVRKLDIKPLSDEARARYTAQWQTIQEQFVDAPQSAVTDAYALVTTVMQERGYPTEDDEQVLADLSVEHAQTVGHFRDARAVTMTAAAGDAATEDLRQALIHYRALFSDLLGTDVTADRQTAAVTAATVPPGAGPADTMPAQPAVPVTANGAANGRVSEPVSGADEDDLETDVPAGDATDLSERY